MKKLDHTLSQTSGLPPGTLVHVGERVEGPVRITVFTYDHEHVEEFQVEDLDRLSTLKESKMRIWINIDGLHDLNIVSKVGEVFDIHPLTLENVVNTTQRPKVEVHDRYLYLVTKMMYIEDQSAHIQWEQVSVLLFDKCVISFQERIGDVFQPIRDRLHTGKGLVRERHSDYLAYALIDAIVDQYFAILENLEGNLDPLEIELLNSPVPEHMERIYRYRKGLQFIRRVVWPLRELLATLDRQQPKLVGKETRWFFRDIYDHVIQVMDRIETMQNTVSGLIELYLSSVSYQMNSVMKVLTIIATIFIPLTFVAGIYGMNFRYMPELGWRWGYPVALGIMLGIVLLMVFYFKRKKWL